MLSDASNSDEDDNIDEDYLNSDDEIFIKKEEIINIGDVKNLSKK